MYLWVNCLLLMMGSVVLALGLGLFARSKINGGTITMYYVLCYSIFATLWCVSYGAIGLCQNLELPPIIRIFGVLGLEGFLVVDLFLVSGMNQCRATTRIISRGIIIMLAVVDFIIFSGTDVDRFVRFGNWTTWYTGEAIYKNIYHACTMVAMMLILTVHGVMWVHNNQWKRQRKFIRLTIIANMIMALFAVPDTLFPLLDQPGISSSGLGAGLCTIVIWYGASRLNSFDIQMGNIVDHIYKFVNAGILVFDLEHKLVMVNPYAKSQLHLSDYRAISLSSIFDISKEREAQIFDEAHQSEQTIHLKTLNGTKTFSLRLNVAKDPYGEPYCYIIAFVDITEELNMVSQLERANNAKSEFLTSVSHEVRTPINSILGFDEMILRDSKEEETLERADNIRRAGKSLLSIINDILDMSQIDSGKMRIDSEEYDIGNVILDCFTLLEPRVTEKKLQYVLSNDEYMPKLLYGDAVRIHQIIINLLSNAVKYTKEGTVLFCANFREKRDHQIDLILSVKDTGIGIREEDIPLIFDSFCRIETQSNRHIEGTGVGLTITKNLVELMDGEISVESVYGEGSTFTVTIPQKVISFEPVGDLNEVRKTKEIMTPKRSQIEFPALRVLVVDDSEMNLGVFIGLLKHTKIHVDAALDGATALEMTAVHSYDLIFLDHMMPEMDGVETLHRIREDAGNMNCHTPVIVMTANAIKGAKEQYLHEGFDDYLEKPVSGEKLEAMICMHLAGH